MRCVSREPPGVSARHIRAFTHSRAASLEIRSLPLPSRPFLPSSSSSPSASRSRRPRPGSTPEVYAGRNAPSSSAKSAFPPPPSPRAHTRRDAHVRVCHPLATPSPSWDAISRPPASSRTHSTRRHSQYYEITTTNHDRHTIMTEDVGKTERARARAHTFRYHHHHHHRSFSLFFYVAPAPSLSLSRISPSVPLLAPILSPSLLFASSPSSRSAASLASCKLINRYLGAFYYIYIYAHTHARVDEGASARLSRRDGCDACVRACVYALPHIYGVHEKHTTLPFDVSDFLGAEFSATKLLARRALKR